MHRNDRAIIYFWLTFMWIVLGFTFVRGIVSIVASYRVALAILVIAMAIGLFVTSAMVTLLRHLNDNCLELYTEDLNNLKKHKSQ